MSRVLLLIAALLICLTDLALTKSQFAPVIRLNNGVKMPVLGLGTYLANEGECEQAVKDAIDAGYRHIDTAYLYGNEKEVGNAIRAKIAEGVIKRENIFVTTKLWNSFHAPDQVEKAFQKSFDDLNITYIDLYLMHFPVAYQRISKTDPKAQAVSFDDLNTFPTDANGKALVDDSIDYLDTWRAMEELLKSDRVRSIGVSNFNSQQVDRILKEGTVKPVTNQVECHPNFNQRKLLDFLAERDITLTAYSPLGRPHGGGKNLAINDPKVQAIAAAHNKTPAQVVLRYTYQNGAVVIPKSTKRNRIEENFNIFDFALNDTEMEIMNGLENQGRSLTFDWDNNSKYFPFNIEF